jgi:hypothetical protein
MKIISHHMPGKKNNTNFSIDKIEANADRRITELTDIYYCGLRNIDTRLKEHRNRHYAAFQLGRYLRYIEKKTEDEAVELIKEWLYQHYPESGIRYFGDEARQSLNDSYDSYEAGLEDTIRQVKNAFGPAGKPFSGRTYIKLNEENLQAYIEDVAERECHRIAKYRGYSKTVEILNYVFSLVRNFETLYIYHSREKFKTGFKTKDQRTITKIFEVLDSIGIMRRLETGNNIAHKSSKYEIILPADCYQKLNKLILLPMKK